jgi:hypothetical protein
VVTLSEFELTIAGVNSNDGSISVTASDDDGHGVSLSVESGDTEIVTATLMEAEDVEGNMMLSIDSHKVGVTTVTVTAADDLGATASASVTVTVTNTRPEISLAMSELSINGLGATSKVGFEVTDKDGDTLSVVASTADPAIATVGVSMDDQELYATSTGFGHTTITVTVDDGADVDNTASAELVVMVMNQVPTVALSATELTIVGVDNMDDTVTVTASDPDGHELVLSVASDDEGVVTAALVDMVVNVSSHKVGMATVTVTAVDELDGMTSASIGVTVTNTRPEFTLAMSELTIVGVGAMGVVGYEATDKDGDTLTVTAESSDESIATATVSMDDEEVHVTSTGFGQATIMVTVDDGADIDNTVSAELMVTVMNQDPVVTLSESELTIAGVDNTNESVTVDASDPDGHSFTLSVISSDTSVATAELMESDDPLGVGLYCTSYPSKWARRWSRLRAKTNLAAREAQALRSRSRTRGRKSISRWMS